MSNNIYGILAEFENPHDLLIAAENVRDTGYINFDCFSPFPIHGMDDAMGLNRSILGYIVGFGALSGAAAGLFLQWWASTIAYPIVISGKPFFSWQAYMIITFILMVLGGALSSLLGMFHLNRMPTYHHPLFNSANFEKATDDGFFICIEYDDPSFDVDETKLFLENIGGKNIEFVDFENIKEEEN
tara:strand:+ start:1227 stop:1784 length:558 start_codon:yes stop_codon:yes gene_type:complete